MANLQKRRNIAALARGRQGDFFEQNGSMFAVDVKTNGSALEAVIPQQLFREPISAGTLPPMASGF